MFRSAAVCFAVALLLSTSAIAQQPSFPDRNGCQWDRGRPGYDHRRYEYPRGNPYGRPGGLPGLVPGLLLGLGVGMIPFIQPGPPATVPPGAGYPQPNNPQAATAAKTPSRSRQSQASSP